MSGTVAESFERAWREGIQSKNQQIEQESDEDSEKEQEKQNERKRAKKRRRIVRGKVPKGRKKVSEFKVRSVPTKERVTSDKYPEIMSVDSEFSNTNNQRELIIAESRFFEKDNTDQWDRGAWHVRPVDYPFVRALLQRKPHSQFDIHQFNDRDRLRASIEPVSRKYEEMYLREPIGSERPCLLGNQCEGLCITNAGDRAFILREFLLPSQQKEYEATGNLPSEQYLCVMCKRKEITRAFINIRADGMGMREDSILQDYRNIVETEGEYCLSDCNVSSRNVWEGLTDPVVLHIRSGYRLVEKDGIRYYDQWRYGYPQKTTEHLFQTPPHPSK